MEAAVLDEAVSILAVALLAGVVLALPVIVRVGVTASVDWFVVVESVSVDEAPVESNVSEIGVASGAAVEAKGSPSSCLCLMSGREGGSRRSIAISPRRASRRKSEESYS